MSSQGAPPQKEQQLAADLVRLQQARVVRAKRETEERKTRGSQAGLANLGFPPQDCVVGILWSCNK